MIPFSAITGEGRDEVIAAVETRLGLDTVTVTFEFDPHDERDREWLEGVERWFWKRTPTGLVDTEGGLYRVVYQKPTPITQYPSPITSVSPAH